MMAAALPGFLAAACTSELPAAEEDVDDGIVDVVPGTIPPGDGTTPPGTKPPGDTTPPAGAAPVLVGAADIADCDGDGDELTGFLLDGIEGTVFTAGDNVQSGSIDEFIDCYEPGWGRHAWRTRPATGNHEYKTTDAAGHFEYYGETAGPPGKGWYSYDLGEWHIVVLNSNCVEAGGCEPGSEQEAWLRADLAANAKKCTLAYFHHPLWSSGGHGPNSRVQPFYDALYDAGADVVLAAHDHMYERYAKQDALGNADPRGIRQFLVGTGGKSYDPVVDLMPNSEVQEGFAFGVFKMTLHPDRYDWEFIPVEGETFTDRGTDTCQ